MYNSMNRYLETRATDKLLDAWRLERAGGVLLNYAELTREEPPADDSYKIFEFPWNIDPKTVLVPRNQQPRSIQQNNLQSKQFMYTPSWGDMGDRSVHVSLQCATVDKAAALRSQRNLSKNRAAHAPIELTPLTPPRRGSPKLNQARWIMKLGCNSP